MTDGVLQATAEAASAGTEALVLERPSLSAEGSLDALDWRLNWASGAASGALLQRDAVVLARLDEFRFEALRRTWDLQDVARVRLEQDGRTELTGLCIAAGEAGVCVESFVFAAGQIETRGAIDRVPVGLLQPWLPVRFAESGYAEGGWSLTGALTNPRGQLTLAVRQLAFVPATEDPAVDLPDLEVSGRVDDGVLSVRLAAAGEGFRVQGDLGLQPLQADGDLTGALEVAVADLAPLRALDQRLETVAGRIDGRLEISGSPSAPRAEGRFELVEGDLKLNSPDMRLTAVDARLRGRDEVGEATAKGRGLHADFYI